ncbi:hypothetical protein VHEMI06374 [[Torrubiella] hemipterigena]|uniref:MYB DNA-binding domain containing protein n=1 Tax=[Torrubiella] hemipterigena TaxID=1531966 RepID=A0A0A1TIZ4_9HYPO|nr:hypothetical protein VHEMI06374 [[Torrubiella] hemipterigena]
MMATIEPRLIHLLNESTTPQLANNDLPPLHALPLRSPGGHPLPPFDRDQRSRDGRYATTNSAGYPLSMVLDDSDNGDSMSNTRDSSPDSQDDGTYKKRKDEFVQLPQPMKKQKASQQQSLVMPPIINGLHEPPPHAALFPPISSSTYEADAHHIAMQEYGYPEEYSGRRSSPETDKSSNGKGRKRATKPRRKWSEEETNHLLLGVNRHGVGKWTSILEDPDFHFNERTAGDLKDRFRTCCPDELRSSGKASRDSKSSKSKSSSKKGLHSENILIEEESRPKDLKKSSDSSSKQKKSRAHRKNMEDLAELGIHGPFKKSHRRERRPFTEQDDREILEGLDIYGPAWTKIQRDARFNLSSRQPTDLRDRVRNKYPTIYHRIEKGTFQTRESTRGNDVMEPSINMNIDHTLKRSKSSKANAAGSSPQSRDDAPRWPAHAMDTGDYAHHSQAFEFGDVPGPHFMGGEMDISRLLLDDSRMVQSSSRHGIDSSSGPSSPTGLDIRRDRYDHYTLKC